MSCTRSTGLAGRVLRFALFSAAIALPARAFAQSAPAVPARAPVGYAAAQNQAGYAATPWSMSYAPAPSAPAAYAPIQAAPAAQTPFVPPKAPDHPKEEKNGETSTGFDVAVVTEVPVLLGGQATLTLPYGLLLQGEVGVLPSAYVNATDSILASAGAYDAATSDMIKNALGDSLVVRLSGGWKPFDAHGLELLGGYTLMSLGGGVSARASIEAATGATLPAEIPDTRVPLHSTIHAVHASLGWRWMLGDHVVLRASLGYLQAVASSSRVDLPASVASNAMVAANLAAANRVVDATLNDAYTKYMKLPLVGLSLGYKF